MLQTITTSTGPISVTVARTDYPSSGPRRAVPRRLSDAEIDADPTVRTSLESLRRAFAVVDRRAPAALIQVRRGLTVWFPEHGLPDNAEVSFGDRLIEFGTVDQSPIAPGASIGLVGHETAHLLVEADEASADLLGLAIARAAGDRTGPAWTHAHDMQHSEALQRNLLDPLVKSLDVLVRAANRNEDRHPMLDPHRIGGPFAQAVASAGISVGTDAIDAVSFQAVLGDIPRLWRTTRMVPHSGPTRLTSAQNAARAGVHRMRVDAMGYMIASEQIHGTDSIVTQTLRDTLEGAGLLGEFPRLFSR